MKNRLIVIFLLVISSSLVFAGLNEDYQALQQQFMKKRRMIRSQVEMNKLSAERVLALKNLLAEYKGKKLADNEQMTLAEVFMSVDELASAWKILKTISEPVEPEKYNAMCARALFGLGKDVMALEYLNKLNHEGQFYGMVNLGRAMSLIKEGKNREAVPYMKNVVGVLTLKDVYRVYALHSLVNYYEDIGKHGEAMRLLGKAAKNSTFSGKARLELKNTEAAMALIGKTAVNFQNIVRRFNGNAPVVFHEKGKVIVLDFFAPQCVPCRTAMANLSKLYLEHRNNGLDVIGVTILYGYYADGKTSERNIPAMREAALVAGFVKAQKATYPMLLLGKQDSLLDYSVTGLPHVVLIDRKGVIRRVFTGMYSQKSFVKAVETLLNEK
ncbi:MAG: TlpA family protein disulfide reductase [Acidobacteria bacterium]|nr:TlpA family protein disulfide reductase [Acidobacteriota bacterium]